MIATMITATVPTMTVFMAISFSHHSLLMVPYKARPMARAIAKIRPATREYLDMPMTSELATATLA